MKRLIALLQVVLAEAGTRCGTSTTRDLKTIAWRTEHEGVSFLTITLPSLCTALQKGLEQGKVTRNQFTGFSGSGGLPRFLRGFLEQVFDSTSGLLLDVPNPDAIQAIRQITLMFSKIALPCTDLRQLAALDKYAECEQDVRRFDGTLDFESVERFERISRVLWADFLSCVDSRVYHEGIIPRHSSGATADKLRGNAKYNQLRWTRRLEDVPLMTHWENVFPSESFLKDSNAVTILEPRDEVPVRVILVPKTLKTPRVIAVEPTCMQYMQQGVLEMIMQEMPRFDNTRHFVMFESQKPNQRLAREGSITGVLATLDLSEASDRVSNQHVRLLLARHPHLWEIVDATRSRKADVPGQGVIRLAKFASMGSALCFPFEALVFATVVFMGIDRASSKPLTARSISDLADQVRVYGDDIIVPVDFVHAVVAELETFGFLVNSDKSFWTGSFRESCGKEFYDGHDVSVAKVRNLIPTHQPIAGKRRLRGAAATLHAERVASLVSFRNQMFHLSYFDTVDYLDSLIEKIIPFPWVKWELDKDGNPSSSSSLLGRHGFGLPSQEYRHDSHIHVPLVKGCVVASNPPASLLDGVGALMKFFLKRGEEPFADGRHLQHADRKSVV